MTKTRLKTLNIASARAPLSREQKTFNSRIKQIGKRRALLADWAQAHDQIQTKVSGELQPLIEKLQALEIRRVHALDLAADRPGLTQAERRLISDLIADFAWELVAGQGVEELKPLYNKHSGCDFDRDQAVRREGLKYALADLLGLEPGDEPDPDSPEDIFKRVESPFARENPARETRRATRKKSEKQLAREARQQADRAQLSRSIQEVFRRLASALHPDRELDPAERERKTALMQRANAAYASGNLLQLLELQLELEHIDQDALNNIRPDRLKHYNVVLKEQLDELNQEIQQIETSFSLMLGLDPDDEVTPRFIHLRLAGEIAEVRRSIRAMEQNLQVFEDARQFKNWLKTMRKQAKMDGFGGVPF